MARRSLVAAALLLLLGSGALVATTEWQDTGTPPVDDNHPAAPAVARPASGR